MVDPDDVAMSSMTGHDKSNENHPLFKDRNTLVLIILRQTAIFRFEF